MRRPAAIARQSRRPAGILGHLVAAVMERETSDVNERAIAFLGVNPGERILDLGTGNGHALRLIAESHDSGVAVGLDHSATMCARARYRNRDLIGTARVEVAQGSSDRLPFASASFDAAVGVHVIYFWDPAEAHLREIARVLRPQGRLVLAFLPGDHPRAARFPPSIYRFRSVAEIEALLGIAGFSVVDRRLPEDAGRVTAYINAQRAQ